MYVKNDKGNVVKVTFGDTSGLRVKLDDKRFKKEFASRHNCEQQKDKTTAYWSCITKICKTIRTQWWG